MRKILIVAAGACLAGTVLTGPSHVARGAIASAMSPSTLQDEGKLRGGLEEEVGNALPGELIPLIIVMRESVDPAVIEQARQMRDKDVRRELVVGALKEVAQRTQGDLLAMLRKEEARGGAAGTEPLWIANVIGAKLTPDVIRAVAERDDVAYLHFDPPIGEEVFPVEPQPAEENPGEASGDFDPLQAIECGVALMRAPQVWDDLNITGRDVVVGVIDTGCCITHPDLRNQIWVNEDETPGNGIDDDGNGYVDDINGWSFDQNQSNSNITDTNGHGTHVSGTVAGDGTNGTTTGMAPDALIMTLKFYNNVSGGQLSVWNCTQYGVENGADVLTASLGWRHAWNPDRRRFREVCENAMAAGVVIVYAAGNEGSCCPPVSHTRTPGDVPDVITVGATDCNDVIASFSSRGPVSWQGIDPYNDWPYPPGKLKPTISAPGVSTVSTSNNCSGYRTLSGTSMATPHVAGAIALILEANPGLDHWEVKQILKDTSVDRGVQGPDTTYGAGRVDAYAAVIRAMEGAAQPADIVDFEVVQGTLIGGTIQSLRKSDDDRLRTNSEFFHEVNEANRMEMVVGFETTVDSPAELNLAIESRVNQPGGIALISTKDWVTGLFVPVHTYDVGQSEALETIEAVDAADLVRPSDGRIEMSIKHVIVAVFEATGFRSFFDYTAVTVE